MGANPLPDILQRLTRTHYVSVETIAEWAERDEKTIYGYMGGKDAPFGVVRRIALRAAATYGFTGFAEALTGTLFEVCPRGDARADGVLDDEIRDMTLASAEAVQAHVSGDKRGYDEAILKVRSVTQRMVAEGDRIPS